MTGYTVSIPYKFMDNLLVWYFLFEGPVQQQSNFCTDVFGSLSSIGSTLRMSLAPFSSHPGFSRLTGDWATAAPWDEHGSQQTDHARFDEEGNAWLFAQRIWRSSVRMRMCVSSSGCYVPPRSAYTTFPFLRMAFLFLPIVFPSFGLCVIFRRETAKQDL